MRATKKRENVTMTATCRVTVTQFGASDWPRKPPRKPPSRDPMPRSATRGCYLGSMCICTRFAHFLQLKCLWTWVSRQPRHWQFHLCKFCASWNTKNDTLLCAHWTRTKRDMSNIPTRSLITHLLMIQIAPNSDSSEISFGTKGVPILAPKEWHLRSTESILCSARQVWVSRQVWLNYGTQLLSQ